MSLTKYSLFIILLTAFMACEPYIEEKIDIGLPPNPSFDILPGDSPNNFMLVNTTEGAFLTQWDLGENGKREGTSVSVNFPFKGSYDVMMTTFTKGGSASSTQSLTVAQNDPNACFGNMQLLTGCNEKVWVLAPMASALHIGPNLNDTWWGNSEADISVRNCHFNDRYIFRYSGEFEFDNQGDFWADDDGNGNVFPAELGLTVGCHASNELPEAYAVWGSGAHKFNITPSSLTITGEGAWIGLYKVGTTEEVGAPQSSITYSILELTPNRMVIYADYGWGVWRFTLIPEN